MAEAFNPFGGGGGGMPGGGGQQPPPPNYEGKDFYKILGVTKKSTDEQIRRQYRRLARQYHPDVRSASTEKDAAKAKERKGTKKAEAPNKSNKKNGSGPSSSKTPSEMTEEEAREHFQAINEAYNILSDKDKRKEYDLQKAYEGKYGSMNGGPDFRQGGGMGGAAGMGSGGMGGMGGGMPNYNGGMGGRGGGAGRGGGGRGRGGGGSNLDEAQMRQAYEMFMKNFGGGGGGGFGGGMPSRGGAPSSSNTKKSKSTKRSPSTSSSPQKKKPAAASRAVDEDDPFNAYYQAPEGEEDGANGYSYGSAGDDGPSSSAFNDRYDAEEALDEEYVKDGGQGSARNMYRDWQRSQRAKQAKAQQEEEERAYHKAQRRAQSTGGVPTPPPKHMRGGAGGGRGSGYSQAYDGSSADGDGRADFEGGGGSGGYGNGGSGGSFFNFKNVYDAYNVFANGPAAAEGGGGGGGMGGGMGRSAPEGAASIFSSLFGSVDDSGNGAVGKKSAGDEGDPFAAFAAGSTADADAAEAARYAAYFKEYQKHNKNKNNQKKNSAHYDGDENQTTDSSSSPDPSPDPSAAAAEQKEREAFVKQFKAFEEYQRQVETAEAERKAMQRATDRAEKRKSTFNMANMFGGGGGDADDNDASAWGSGAAPSSSDGGSGGKGEENAGSSSSGGGGAAAEEEYTEDIFGNRRPKKKKARKSSSTSDADTGAAVDPLEAAYAEDSQREAFDPIAAKQRKREAQREEKRRNKGTYLVDDEDLTAAEEARRKKKAANNAGGRRPSGFGTDDEFMNNFDSFGRHPNTAYDEANKNSPSTNTFADLARGWASKMAQQYAGTKTMPDGVVPDEAVDPEAAAKHQFSHEETGKNGGRPRSAAPKKKKKAASSTSAKAKRSAASSTAKKKKANAQTKRVPSAASSKGPANINMQQPQPQPNIKKKAKRDKYSSEWNEDVPDLSTRPSDEEMEELKDIFTDTPPDRASFPKEPPAHDDPWWNTIFKDGKGVPAAGVKDVPRVPGKLNGPVPASKGRRAPSTSTATPSSTSGSAAKASTDSGKTASSSSKASSSPASSASEGSSSADNNDAVYAAGATIEEDFGFTKSSWDDFCSLQQEQHERYDDDDDDHSGRGPSDGANAAGSSGKQRKQRRACVIIFSSATSMKGINGTLGATAKRFPLSAKTFFVTRPQAVKVSDFIYAQIEASYADAKPTASSSPSTTGSDIDDDASSSSSTANSGAPLVFKDALCGKSYAKATLTNAGEFCAVIVRGSSGGGSSFSSYEVAIVGNQRTSHLDLSPHLRSELAKNDEMITAMRKEKGISDKKKGLTSGKEAEAMIYLPLKRNKLSFIKF